MMDAQFMRKQNLNAILEVSFMHEIPFKYYISYFKNINLKLLKIFPITLIVSVRNRFQKMSEGF
ncbi:hypothetical protein JOC59_000077 [Weissella beninensis]|nr:hypothetical protein [Periweissella beninensis]